MASSASSPARPLPALAHLWNGAIAPLDVDVLAPRRGRRVPRAARGGVGRARARVCVERGVRVFDLSGAFRLRDDGRRARAGTRTRPALPAVVGYGLTERDRDAIAARAVRRRARAAIRRRRCSRSAPLVRRRPPRRRHHRSTRSRACRARARRRASARTSPSATAACRPTACSRTGTPPRSSRSSAAAGDLRAAPGAARPRHPRDDLRPRARRARPTTRSPRPTTRPTATRRSCGCAARRCPRSSTSPTPTSATSAGARRRTRTAWWSSRSSTTCSRAPRARRCRTSTSCSGSTSGPGSC